MADQIQILSVNGYMQKYAVDGIGKGADRWQVKRDMLDEFRREIFNTAVFRLGAKVFSDEWEGNEKDRKKLENIIDNANKKWRAVCREFEKYSETSGLLKETDLQDYLEDKMDISEPSEDDEEDKALEDLKEDVIHDEETEEADNGSEQAERTEE